VVVLPLRVAPNEATTRAIDRSGRNGENQSLWSTPVPWGAGVGVPDNPRGRFGARRASPCPLGWVQPRSSQARDFTLGRVRVLNGLVDQPAAHLHAAD